MSVNLPILAIDKDIEVYERQVAAWTKPGISIVRVESVCEAIVKLEKSRFLFVGINADNISYLSQLRILCDFPPPVLIATSKYSVEEHNAARKAGADSYVLWDDDDNKNVEAALVILDQITEQQIRHRKTPKILHHDKLLISIDHQQTFIDTVEIDLTKTEYNILVYLCINKGILLSPNKILQRVWRSGYEHITLETLWNHIKNLRKKLVAESPECDYIENKRGFGYRFKT